MIDINDILQHELYVERLATGAYRAIIIPSLDDLYGQIKAILDRTDVILTPQQLSSITAQVSQVVSSSPMWTTLTEDNLLALAEYEATWSSEYFAEALDKPISAPNRAQVTSYVTQAIMSLSQGGRAVAGVWSQFLEQNQDSQTRIINGAITRGYARGETSQQIARDIRRNFDGVIKREAEALTRTGYAHFQSAAGDAMIESNLDVFQEYYYAITFDNRTSDTCIALDKFNVVGKRFKVGDPKAPAPPLHFNCRTRRIAVPEGFVPTDTKAAVGGQIGKQAAEEFERRKDRLRTASQVRYKGRKDSDIFKAGQIKADTSYATWLKRQPNWFIKDTLGARRAKLFTDGKLSLDKFSDMTGRPLTLDELRQRHPLAFERAGLGG
jgi:SPP1 gp7 family putative phage head morphogenesis protein